MLDWLVNIQRWIYSSLTADLLSFAATQDWAVLMSVLPFGVLFGAIHALTPGHGKSVLASYLVGSQLAALRASAVACVLSLTHVGSAVIIALAAAPLVTRTLGGAGRAPALETASHIILIAIGIWFLVRAIRGRKHVHGEGVAVSIAAGLVPCPLTLFVMFFALSRGVPEAGMTFAVAMATGIAITLSAVALLAVFARDSIVGLAARYSVATLQITRILDGLSALLLIGIAVAGVTR